MISSKDLHFYSTTVFILLIDGCSPVTAESGCQCFYSGYLRVGELPVGVPAGQPVALLDEDVQALTLLVVAHGEEDVSAHVHAVVVAGFAVDAHDASQTALQRDTHK